jgi:hypothetical protein
MDGGQKVVSTDQGFNSELASPLSNAGGYLLPQPAGSRSTLRAVAMQADWGRTIDALHPVREILETWRLETHLCRSAA